MRSTIFVAVAALLSASLAARANSISFTEADNIYGAQSGSVSNAIGSADILYFAAAVHNTYETIDLTTASGVVTDTIFSPSGMPNRYNNPGDEFEFAGIASGNAAIGTMCIASSAVSCVINTGGTINLTNQINLLDGSSAGFQGSLVVTANDSQAPSAVTPEPSSIALLGTGLLSLAGAIKQRLA